MPETKTNSYHLVGKILEDSTRVVYLNDSELNPERSQELHNHSPDGCFSWGYMGSGPAQLALAILLEVTNKEDLSHQLHQKFKGEVIARLNMDSGFDLWIDIKEWVRINSMPRPAL